MSEVIWITDQQDLEDLLINKDKVVIDFTAPAWCNPCQQFAPHYESAAEKSDATFVAVDVDEAPWAMADYGVFGVPTVRLYRDGEFEKTLTARTVITLLNEIKE